MAINYNPTTVSDGLVLALDAANTRSYSGSGTTWTDISYRGNNGTLTNGPTYSSANGGSIVFDGVNDYTLINLSKETIGSTLTISIWVSCIGAQTSVGIFQVANGLTDTNPWILLQRTNSTTVSWYLNAQYRITNTISDSSYTNLTLTYNGTTWIVYKNGISNGNYVGDLGSFFGNSIWLGNGYNGYFSGNIAQVSIYNRALTADEILQNYNALKGRFGL